MKAEVDSWECAAGGEVMAGSRPRAREGGGGKKAELVKNAAAAAAFVAAIAFK